MGALGKKFKKIFLLSQINLKNKIFFQNVHICYNNHEERSEKNYLTNAPPALIRHDPYTQRD